MTSDNSKKEKYKKSARRILTGGSCKERIIKYTIYSDVSIGVIFAGTTFVVSKYDHDMLNIGLKKLGQHIKNACHIHNISPNMTLAIASGIALSVYLFIAILAVIDGFIEPDTSKSETNFFR